MEYHIPQDSLAGAPANSSSGRGHGGGNSKAMFFATRQRASEQATECYAYALAIIIAIFVASHWIRYFSAKWRLSPTGSTMLSPFITMTRIARRIFIRKMPGFTSTGHAVVVLVWVAINLALSFTGFEWDKPTNFAARFGWMSAANLALVVFLAMKNTPLAILTSYSYERLNPLHQIAGYATAVYMILHGVIYSWYFIQAGRWEIMHEHIVTAGIILGFAMLAAVVEAMVLRRLQYELFYVFHVAMFIMTVVTLALHRPELQAEKVGIIACIVAGIWGLDRLIRLFRLLYNSVNNKATIHPLPNGGTRILLSKPLPCAVPGRHCYVWLPQIRLLESHPFTIVGTAPAELIVNSYSGFTRDLHKHALKNPGATLKVSVEGPYGKFPDPMNYDKVVMVAGGSGASFTFGLAANILSRMTETSTNQIDFIWAVKTRDHLKAIRDHVHAPKVALSLHATKPVREHHHHHLSLPGLQHSNRSETETSESSGDVPPITPVSPTEKHLEHHLSSHSLASTSLARIDSAHENADPEKDIRNLNTDTSRMSGSTQMDLPVQHGRPDVVTLVKQAVKSVDKDKKVLITACGPTQLMKVVRNTAASCITADGPSVEFHGEEFGW